MYWLSFVALSLVLYLPPANLAAHLWQWAARCTWWLLLTGWVVPAWLAYAWWLALVYVALGTALLLAHRRLPEDSRLAREALRLSRAGLGALEVLMVVIALAVVLTAWPVLPAMSVLYGWRAGLSVPVATLAGLYLLAEMLRLAESSILADRIFAAGRVLWLIEHGHYR